MATTVYLRVNPNDIASGARSYWGGDTFNHGATSGYADGVLLSDRGGGATTAGGSTSVAGPATVLAYRFISAPLAADVTISSAISWNVWGLESSMSANASLRAEVFRLQPNGTVTSIGSNSSTTELGTSSAVRTGSITPTSTAFTAGDCIGLTMSFVDAGGTMGAGFLLSVRVNGSTGGADGDSFLTFTDNLSFSTTAPTGSTLYLTDTNSDANPGGSVEKALQIDGSAPSTFTKVRNTAAGPTSPLQWTDSAGGSAVEWYTPPLTAVTLAAGLMQLSLDVLQSASNTNASFLLEVYKTDSSGSSPTLLAKYWGNGNPLSTNDQMTTTSADAAVVYSIPVAATSIGTGERLKVVLYVDDALYNLLPMAFGGTSAGGNLVTGRTVTAQLGGSGGGYLKLPTTVTQYTPAPPMPRPQPPLMWR